jgi:hypothetical protein
VRLPRNANVSISATVLKDWVSIDLETIVEYKFITLILLTKTLAYFCCYIGDRERNCYDIEIRTESSSPEMLA